MSTTSAWLDAVAARAAAGAPDLTPEQFAIIAPLMKERPPRVASTAALSRRHAGAKPQAPRRAA